MQFSTEIYIQLLILALGICGFFVAKHIRNHKVKNTPLVCPINMDCHSVVHSDYSKFFGIPVEVLGMIYYGFVVFFYIFLILFGASLSESLVFLLLPIGTMFSMLSLAAFLFSVYLIGVQIFILRKGCSWCIVSALISALIFALTMIK